MLNGFSEQIPCWLLLEIPNIPLISICLLLTNPFISYMPNLVAFVKPKADRFLISDHIYCRTQSVGKMLN
jgi:hypothetical protein